MASVLPPVSVMATWPAPNYVNPESLSRLLIGFEIPLIALTTIVVAMRMISRFFLSKVALDDWLIFFAAIPAIIMMVENVLAIKYGWGLHLYDFKLEWLEPSQKIALATEELFTLTVSLTKLSILCFYYRVFASFKTFKILILAGIVYVSVFFIMEVILLLNQCTPVRAFWDLSVPGKCIDKYAAVISTSLLNSISDFYIFVIPVKYVWSLHLPQKQRLGLIIAFGLGAIVCVAGLVRVYYIKVAMHDSWDITWYGVPLYIATAIESDIGILCASIPALKPLFVRLFPQLSSTSQNRSRGADGLGMSGLGTSGLGDASYKMNKISGPGSSPGESVVRSVQRTRNDTDNDSEEYILEEGLHDERGIQKRVEIQVTSTYMEK